LCVVCCVLCVVCCVLCVVCCVLCVVTSTQFFENCFSKEYFQKYFQIFKKNIIIPVFVEPVLCVVCVVVCCVRKNFKF
jgi:hypothetical protein